MSEERVIINWTVPMLRRFKEEYAKQQAGGKDKHATFKFDGHEFVMGYAKYLIEYLELRFGPVE